MESTEDLLALIEARRIELGLSQVDVGRRAFGKADNSVISNMKRGSAPTYERLVALCNALDLEIYIGPRRPAVSALSESQAEYRSTSTSPMRSGYSTIPWLEPKLGSGSAPVAFLDSWLAANGLVIDNLAAATASSVHILGFDPTKTLALIDRAAPHTGFHIWLLRDSGRKILAPVSFVGGDLIIESSDRASPARLVKNWRKGEVRPAGKVVWLSLVSHI